MKNILFILLTLTSSFSLAGGSTTGAGPGREMGKTLNGRDQVYFIGKSQAELNFATADKSGNQVRVHSLRPEEIGDETLWKGLQRSQQTKKWETLREDHFIGTSEASSSLESP